MGDRLFERTEIDQLFEVRLQIRHRDARTTRIAEGIPHASRGTDQGGALQELERRPSEPFDSQAAERLAQFRDRLGWPGQLGRDQRAHRAHPRVLGFDPLAIAARRERSDSGGAGTGIRPSRDMREHPRKLENTEGVRVHHAEGARRCAAWLKRREPGPPRALVRVRILL